MAEELSIRIRICGRAYPMRVSTTGEATMRATSQALDAQIASYQQQFPDADYQDVLAMVAFDALSTQRAQPALDSTTHAQLEELTQTVQKALARGDNP